ncbi:Msh6, partial [Symbiodinium sp. KB8]
MDSDILVKEAECGYMKGESAHAGFPEIAYGKMSDILVRKGYRVARIEQTETPDQLKERNAKLPKGVKKDKVVRRELCGMKSKGTQTYGPQDRAQDSDGEHDMVSETTLNVLVAGLRGILLLFHVQSGPNYLYSIVEEALHDLGEHDDPTKTKLAKKGTAVEEVEIVTRYGVSILDAATGEFK